MALRKYCDYNKKFMSLLTPAYALGTPHILE
jgi:hypothetical protein